jgi:hypothetical protein
LAVAKSGAGPKILLPDSPRGRWSLLAPGRHRAIVSARPDPIHSVFHNSFLKMKLIDNDQLSERNRARFPLGLHPVTLGSVPSPAYPPVQERSDEPVVLRMNRLCRGVIVSSGLCPQLRLWDGSLRRVRHVDSRRRRWTISISDCDFQQDGDQGFPVGRDPNMFSTGTVITMLRTTLNSKRFEPDDPRIWTAIKLNGIIPARKVG